MRVVCARAVARVKPGIGRMRFGLVLGAIGWLLVAGALGTDSALAGPWWHVSAHTVPTVLHTRERAKLIVNVTNVGDGGVNATSSPVSISDTLPPGLEAVSIQGLPAFRSEAAHLMSCSLATVSCVSQPEVFPPFEGFEVVIEVNVKPDASARERDQASVQGGIEEDSAGEAPSASTTSTILTGQGETWFGVQEEGYGLRPELEGGSLDDQAGSHPFQLTTRLALNQILRSYPITGTVPAAPALPRQLAFKLPPGLIGNPQAVPQCTDAEFSASYIAQTNACPARSAIGVAVVNITEPLRFGTITRPVPLWNLEPAPGEPARLGFEVIGVPVVLDASLRSDGDYGVSISVNNAPQAAQLLSSEVTIWGAPADPDHASSRGWGCLDQGAWSKSIPCEPERQPEARAFLTMPTSCTGELFSTVEGHTWPVQTLAGETGQIFSLQGPSTETQLPGFTSCEILPFEPSIGLQTSETDAATPTGLHVDVHIPQDPTLERSTSESDLKDTHVTLPAGLQLSPSSANGLQACGEAQIGYLGPAGSDPLSPGAPQPLRFLDTPVECPEASKVGIVRVHTPLLANELTGAVYLAEPAPQGETSKNPFNSLLALYVVAEDPVAGVLVKLAGEVQLNPTTGQISSSFLESPQVPFEDFELEFFNGPRAATTTPASCGTYQTQALFTPWSGQPPTSTETGPGELPISAGVGGSSCPSGEPFAPRINTGVSNLQAGAFTPFTLQLERPDGDQALSGITLTLPPGAAALLSNTTPCPEPQGAVGACGPSSEIGQATVSAGLGADPYSEHGRLYITGPYQNAPFGLEIVTPAVAGPFNLGQVIVRSKIEVNPHTAQVTVTSPVPTYLQGVGMPPTGIPIQLKHVYLTVDRSGFEYNPTNCQPKQIEAALEGQAGGQQHITEPFQITGCQTLPFKPTVTAQTQGHTSKADGASLGLTFKSKSGEAHVAKTILTIPATLPARLTTIQKACLAKVFEANPAACPEGSDIGTAVVHTPVLKSPLSGPIYLVSHGNAAWPDAELVLQSEGITVILDGQTAIKKGVTTSSFLSVPDAPFESVEATLPEGSHSALTTNLPLKARYSLCGQSLTIPTSLTGQNGTAVSETVKVAVEGCHAVKATKARKPALVVCKPPPKHSELAARPTSRHPSSRRERNTRCLRSRSTSILVRRTRT